MDIPGSAVPAALNAATTTTSASGLPIAAGSPAQAGVNGQQANKAADPTQPAPAEQQTAFNDALLSIINGLLQGQGKEVKPLIVAGATTDKSDEKKGKDTETTLTAQSTTPQQMLDSLLMASQQPLGLVTLSSTPSQTGDALLMNHRSGVNGNVVASGNIHGGISPLAASLQANSASPVIEQNAQPMPVITKGMQSVVPQPLVSALGEAPAPLAQAVSGQSTPAVSNDKAASFQTQLATMKLEGGEDRLAQQLHAALGERLQVQVKNQIQHATIRLDPPDMGKIDISMQIENGRMQVHINASQGEVYRALQQVSNDLRQSLTEQNFVQVNVQVSSQSGQQQGGKEPPFSDAQAAVLASAEPDSDSQQTDLREDDSVLLTV